MMKNLFQLSLMIFIPLSSARAQIFPPPQNLFGLWICDSTHVRWNPPDSGDVTGYNIYRLEEEGGDWFFRGWVSSDTDSFVEQGWFPFCYGVTALYNGGESDRAEICEFDILDVFSFPPERIEAEAVGDSIWLRWSPGQFGCGVPVGYDIFRLPVDGIYTLIASVPPVSTNYLDLNLDDGMWCYYVDIVSTGGRASSAEACATVSPAGIAGELLKEAIPKSYDLRQNYPNPFNPSTTISFDIPGDTETTQPVSLTIYDMRGMRVRTLVNSNLEPGSHKIHWNGRNDIAKLAPSGIYLYTLKVGKDTYTRKMTLVK